MKIMLRFVFPIVLGFVLAWPSTSQEDHSDSAMRTITSR